MSTSEVESSTVDIFKKYREFISDKLPTTVNVTCTVTNNLKNTEKSVKFNLENILDEYSIHHKCIYEYLDENIRNRRVYFDIDSCPNLETVIELCNKFIEMFKLEGCSFQIAENIYSRHLENENDKSYHVIFDCYVNNPYYLRMLINEFIKNNEKACKYLDRYVYGTTQQFRLPYCYNGIKNCKYPIPETRIVKSGEASDSFMSDVIEKIMKEIDSSSSKYDFHRIVYGSRKIQFIQDISDSKPIFGNFNLHVDSLIWKYIDPILRKPIRIPSIPASHKFMKRYLEKSVYSGNENDTE